jgi:hypothetical protein
MLSKFFSAKAGQANSNAEQKAVLEIQIWLLCMFQKGCAQHCCGTASGVEAISNIKRMQHCIFTKHCAHEKLLTHVELMQQQYSSQNQH